ncbi:DNA-methyltransferase [uncultured Nostoc sp.]|uniref:DNA-methyltransferase n=1 Tax=uncultured Nostoc sp. TaxID=340711 RepID=UPI0035C9A9A7
MNQWAFEYQVENIGKSVILYADCFEWLSRLPENSIHAVVTDPPYGVKEYDFDQLLKRANRNGGIWRIPPSFDGHQRAPLPRFTALTTKERLALKNFFVEWAKLVVRVLRPGAHVLIASNAFLSQLVFSALVEGGLEFRKELIRLVRTLRGGDACGGKLRPKNAEDEFPDVSSMLRGCYEPWGVLRKPIPVGMKLSECLREFQTGGLRRNRDGTPLGDVIASERTPQKERAIANHPSLKPQSFLRQVVYAALPLGEGLIVDTFMGSGSTVAAAEAIGLCCIGIERNLDYYEMSCTAISKLINLETSSQNITDLQLTLW